jgi:cobyrinic acid a,c-diamide synthase
VQDRLVPALRARLIVAGTHSGVGKTTVATGLLAALRAAGHRVAGAKVGPDYIDPGYHALAAGRPPRNLDPWICGSEAVAPLAARAAAGADLLIVEGVMGLFDGSADGTTSSTADVARLLDAPVLLVVDAGAVAGSVAAVVHGFATFDPRLRLAGVVLNNVGSDGHEVLLREALAPLGLPVVGVLRRDDRLVWRDRHLGLVPVVENPTGIVSTLERLGSAIAQRFDLETIVALGRAAPVLGTGQVPLPPPGPPVRIGVAAGRAFSFLYTDTEDALAAGGAQLVPFDPLVDGRLPERLDGVIVGGGFPEVHAAELAANQPLLTDVRSRIGAGLVTWAECGGLLWLCRTLDGAGLAGVVPARGRMTDRLTLGYRSAVTTILSPVGNAGTTMRGHEFHYSTVDPPGDALALAARFGAGRAGFARPTLLASYLHHHPGGDPSAVAGFLDCCRANGQPRQS